MLSAPLGCYGLWRAVLGNRAVGLWWYVDGHDWATQPLNIVYGRALLGNLDDALPVVTGRPHLGTECFACALWEKTLPSTSHEMQVHSALRLACYG